MSDVKLSGQGRTERGAGESGARVPRRVIPSRHGAISRDLTKYASYKSWAEKVRGAFAPEADDTPGDNGGANGAHRR